MSVEGDRVVVQTVEVDERDGRVQGDVIEPDEGTPTVRSHARDYVAELGGDSIGNKLSLNLKNNLV